MSKQKLKYSINDKECQETNRKFYKEIENEKATYQVNLGQTLDIYLSKTNQQRSFS